MKVEDYHIINEIEINLEDLVCNYFRNPRNALGSDKPELDEETVRKYTDDMRGGDIFPLPYVYKNDEGKYVVLNGNHTVEAFKRQMPSPQRVRVRVLDIGKTPPRWVAYGLNRKNGLQIPADKVRQFVRDEFERLGGEIDFEGLSKWVGRKPRTLQGWVWDLAAQKEAEIDLKIKETYESTKSLKKTSDELKSQGIKLSHEGVRKRLKQSTKKEQLDLEKRGDKLHREWQQKHSKISIKEMGRCDCGKIDTIGNLRGNFLAASVVVVGSAS